MGNTQNTEIPSTPALQEANEKKLLDPDTSDNTYVTFQSLYKNQPGLVAFRFFRRFGCILCREAATGISSLKPIFDEKYGKDKVKWVGIGLEKLGYDEFKQGNYFDGKIYLDESHDLYKSLDFVELGKASIVAKLFMDGTISKAKSAEKQGFKGDYKGNKSQLGGLLILSPQGEVVYSFKQQTFGDEPNKEDVINAVDTYFTQGKKEQPKL